MGSINATVFAQKVSGSLRANKIVNKRKLALEAGYAPSVADKPSMITKTKSYKVAFALENKQILENIDKDIAKAQEALSRKNLDKEEYKTIIQSLDTLIKNKQLLSGGATANVGVAISISEHIAGKYGEKQVNNSDAPTENGST